MILTELQKRPATPSWLNDVYLEYKAVLKKFGYQVKQRARWHKEDTWLIGGGFFDVDAENMLSPEKRMSGLQKAMSKLLFDLKERGFTVSTASFRQRYHWSEVETDLHPLYPDDTLAYIETRVRDRLYNREVRMSDDTIHYIPQPFVFGISKVEAPKPAEKPAPRQLRVVKGAK